MDWSLLDEQIERMRRMSDRMSQAHDQIVENVEEIARARESIQSGPLHEVRDYRTHETKNLPDERAGQRKGARLPARDSSHPRHRR